jgi:hypothetical protein
MQKGRTFKPKFIARIYVEAPVCPEHPLKPQNTSSNHSAQV